MISPPSLWRTSSSWVSRLNCTGVMSACCGNSCQIKCCSFNFDRLISVVNVYLMWNVYDMRVYVTGIIFICVCAFTSF